ncbi:MAG: ATP-dependent DNA helicase RecQ, partial [Flavobacteriaceae bacterium]|nr:ATP-dependent DNA helicase RecQ [Flavobacteriaceae bacterium]
MYEALKILDQYWGFKSFKPLQEEIIDAVLDNQDVLALLPTGGGKSLCYQLPALMKDGICVVVSPLIALMKDQVSALKQKGIKAVSITSGISYKDLDTILDNCIYGYYKFLYLSPERLQQDIVQERLQLMKVSLIAVDEAHCISQWGHDFRPAYKQISTLRTLLPSVNVLALTATAKPVVIKEIIQDLDFIDYEVFQASYNRANIGYQVIYTEDKEFRLVEILNKNPGLAIIYVRSRRKAEEINTYLNSKGIKSEFFHGGIDSKAKESKLEIFMQERVRVMVATTAFGMGIDKSNVRSVFHFDLPENLESYYQEAGRAGRDGLRSKAFTLVKKGDEKKLEEQFLGNLPNAEDVKLIYRKLCNFLYVPYGEGANTTFNLNFNEFCKAYNLNSSLVYNVFNLLDRTGLIKMDPHFTNKVKLQFIVENKMLFAYLHKQTNYQTLVKAILRSYGGIMDNLLNIDIQKIAVKSG